MTKPKEAPAPGGRPSKYRAVFVKKAKTLARMGATDREIAAVLEVDPVTLWRWAQTHPKFCNALKVGKSAADDRVERSLFQRAAIDGETTACIFWLKNRRPKVWRDRKETELSTPPGRPLELQTSEDQVEKAFSERLAKIAASRSAAARAESRLVRARKDPGGGEGTREE